MARSKPRQKTKKKIKEKELIVIDDKSGLIFESEKDLYAYFAKAIEQLDQEYSDSRAKDDYTDTQQLELEEEMELTLDEPDEVWKEKRESFDFSVYYYIRKITQKDESFFHYVVACYVSEEDQMPTFVLTHFPTKNPEMVENYRKADLVYDRQFEKYLDGALEGDSLSEGDPLALGLYSSMIKLRNEKDILQPQFKEFAALREDTIESADEIWRTNDLDGNILVYFIKEYPDHEIKNLTYVAVTQEDENSNVHALLFSFPTTDETLVDRYRHGENLQAEEVTQESSH
jgi:hypothetical protein